MKLAPAVLVIRGLNTIIIIMCFDSFLLRPSSYRPCIYIHVRSLICPNFYWVGQRSYVRTYFTEGTRLGTCRSEKEANEIYNPQPSQRESGYTDSHIILMTVIYTVCAFLTHTELFLHHLTPIYMVARVSTYKMYILLYTYFSEFYPHHQREAPELYKKIAEDYTTSIRSSSDSYDRDSFILKRRVGFVKESVAQITERELQDYRIVCSRSITMHQVPGT